MGLSWHGWEALGQGLNHEAMGAFSAPACNCSAVAIGANLSFAAGTLSASGGGSTTTIVAGSGLSGGTITTSGTISLAAIAAASLSGNSGTVAAVPAAIAIGSNITLASGTLSASNPGTGTVTNIATGAGLSGGPVTTSGTILADWRAGTVSSLGFGLAITTGVLALNRTLTDNITSTGTNQATAFALTSDVNIVTSGTGMVVLSSTWPAGSKQIVLNMGIALPVLPPSGAHFGSGAANAAVTLAAGTPDTPVRGDFFPRNSTAWAVS